MTSVIVKVTLPPASDADDAITRSLLLPAEPAPSWSALARLVQDRFGLNATPAALTYIDGQEDEITVSASEEVAELWATAFDDGPLSLSIGPSQTRASTIDTTTLLASVRHALESNPSMAHDLHSLVKSVAGPGNCSHHCKGRLSSLHGCHAHRRHGETNGKFGRRRGGRGGVAGFRGRRSAHHSFDCPDESSGSESETLDQASDGEGPAPLFSRHHGAHHEQGRHRHRPHHALGPPPLFPPPPPLAFGGFPHPPPFHRRFP
ncbi:hypothetical protein NBRC10512_006939 [Rhodotorula toruloides]|uniref:RHTO0S02e11782g1_1 n=2 Tax=Rhodotorula toruloides TaxID=5286 RepID=A0A061AHY4_RHOTO|nr:Phox/Bem1p domain containing protein [Rhodotorula toruloides NP11]EMS23521.1 Phox/Bem1p domain containing protein [Rhodotorula toruloides NP11]CDR37190.1 RHTO0S02e11782g1_1 [Rhodotorula toruloides]